MRQYIVGFVPGTLSCNGWRYWADEGLHLSRAGVFSIMYNYWKEGQIIEDNKCKGVIILIDHGI